MRYSAKFGTVLVCLLLIAVARPTIAGDLVSYQGRLTDATGVPVVDGAHALTFRVFNSATGGLPLWSDQFSSVQTTGGLFSTVLGSQAALDLASLGDGNLYLEIQVGLAPLTPRTLLTSAPRAAVAGKVFGDIETSQGAMLIKRNGQDSIIALGGNDMGPFFKMFDPQPEPPGKLFEILANSGSGPSMSFFNQAGQVMGVEPSPFNTGFSIKMFDPQPEPPGKMFEITTTYATPKAAFAPEAGGSTSLRMFGLSDLGGELELVNLSAASTEAELRIGPGAAIGSSGFAISAKSNSVGSTLELSGPGGGPLPFPPVILTTSDAGARVGIGTSTPTQALQVVGNICYTGTIGACSDGKYKKDVEPVENALEVVSELEGVRYQWKTDEYPEQGFSSETQIGFIAQDVKKVLPEVVMEQPDGSLAVDYGRLTPVLLQAVKELKKQNEELEKRLRVLEQDRK